MYIRGQNLGFPMSLESQVELTPSEDAEGEGRDCLVMSSSLRLRFLLCLQTAGPFVCGEIGLPE